jgi:hypothetical protein
MLLVKVLPVLGVELTTGGYFGKRFEVTFSRSAGHEEDEERQRLSDSLRAYAAG